MQVQAMARIRLQISLESARSREVDRRRLQDTRTVPTTKWNVGVAGRELRIMSGLELKMFASCNKVVKLAYSPTPVP
jgi:hypothetical protein